MGKLSLITQLKLFISGLGWKMFIWGLGMTEEKYFETIYEQEKFYRERREELDS